MPVIAAEYKEAAPASAAFSCNEAISAPSMVTDVNFQSIAGSPDIKTQNKTTAKGNPAQNLSDF